jgi:hypothetical protein
MVTYSASNKIIRTGVAISPTELCAADIRLRGNERGWRTPLQPPPADGGSWSSLASALSDLARTLGITDGILSVALMPPLTEVRRLELPPLRDDELQRALARNASRYFVNARGPQMVGALPAGKRVRGAPVPVVAASASARLIATIRATARQVGWTVETVAPAETAWAGAAVSLWPVFSRDAAYALFAHDDRTDLLALEGGRLAGVRRFRPGAADAGLIAEVVGRGARVGVAGTSAARRDLAAALGAAGISVASASGEWSDTVAEPSLLAAQFSDATNGPVLRGEETVELDRARARRATMLVGAAAAGLFVLSAAIELWGAHHKLALVREERARIRPQLATTLVGRTTVDATTRNLITLSGIDASSPHWSAIVTALSEAIPDDAYLTAVRARQDSLVIDGLAEHASRVFDALQQSKLLVDVKSAAPVRREQKEDGTALDHFTIAARLARGAQ